MSSAEEGITLNLSKLLKITPLPWLLHEDPIEAIEYIYKELQEYQARWGKTPDAFFIEVPAVTTIFGIPIKVKGSGVVKEIKKRPHYY